MKNILLIDDDRDDAELFKEALEEIDPEVRFHYFDDAEKAIEKLLNESGPLPDMIFLDINMPVISGWECLIRFKKSERLSVIPVVMYTTSSLAREKQIAQDLGASGFITKPNDYKLLKEVLVNAIRIDT